MRHDKTLLAAALVTLAALAPARAHADLRVVATVPDLAAIAKEIGGSKARVTALSLPTQDPHFVDAKPSHTLELNRADLLLAVGAELELGWLPTLQTGARNPKVLRGGKGYLECASEVGLRDVPAAAVDRSQGDIHPSGNPHYLYDPRAAATCARAIAAKMALLDPSNAKVYLANVRSFTDRLNARRRVWEKRLAPYRGAPVVTYHRSWPYLLDWLGLVEVATLEPKPGIPPSPNHVAKVIGTGRSRKVKALLQEAYYPSKTGTLAATKMGAVLIRVPAGADVRRGQTYIEHMEALVSMLDKALGKK